MVKVSNRFLLGSAVFVLSVLVFSACAMAEQTLRVGYVDIKKVFDEYQQTQQSRASLEAAKKEKQDMVEKKRKDVEQIEKDFEAQQSVMKDDKKREKQAEIQKAKEDLQKFIDSSLSDLLQTEKNLTDKIVSDIKAVVKDLAITEKYDYVVVNDAILYGGENITDKVISALNKR